MNITKIAISASVVWLLMSGAPSAQSSGNFTYGTVGLRAGDTGCVLQESGDITGGLQCSMECTVDEFGNSTCTTASGDCVGVARAGIKTNSGKGNVFVVRPAAVVGLLTDVKLSSKQGGSDSGAVSSSALAGVDFKVTVDPLSGQPNPTLTPNFGVTYASRYIQISTNLFQVLATECLALDGGCFLSFSESTVSAHSFDWIASELASGDYGVEVEWKSALGGSGISRALTCVGPVNLTVQQNKVFSFNSVNTF